MNTSYTTRFFLQLTLAALAWTFVVFSTPSTVLWRDSGEFILAAFYLDIAHPPGYPLLGQLSNLFALIPIGPIAWRVHLFSGLSAVLFLIGVTFTTARFLTFLGIRSRSVPLTFIPAALLFLSPAFIRGALSVEGYVLHGLLLLILLNLFLSYLQTRDLRPLIAAAFVGGISLGNHISGIVSFIPVGCILLFDFRRTARALIPAMAAFLLGLGVYGYLPMRSLANPPLDTGAPYSPERFLNHVSNARDRFLRPTSPPLVGANLKEESVFARGKTRARHDLHTLSREISPVALVGAILGFCLLARRAPALGGGVLAIIGGNLVFFSGWDPDPWVVSIALLALLGTVALGYLLDRLKRPRSRLLLTTGLLIAVFATTAQPTAPFEAPKIAAFTAPRDAARALVDPLPYGAPVITEASWFIALYLSMIEGYREDVLPIYQPSILFPALFAPLELNVGGTSLRAEAEIGGVLGAASESSLRSYIDTIGGRGPVFFEPNIELNARFRAIAHLRADGSSTLVRQQSSAVSPNYIDAAGARLTALREAALSDQIFFGADTQQYFETILTYTADLLRVAGHPHHAVALIERVCPPTQPPCSITIDANRALYLVDIGRSREAAEVLLAASLGEPGARRRLIPTLQIALSRLAPEEIEALQGYTPYRDIITQAGF